MTFLGLVKRLAIETGVELQEAITSVADTPATMPGETTEMRNRLVRWIRQAWIDLQQDQPVTAANAGWRFMQARDTLPLAADTFKHDIITEVGAANYDGILPWTARGDARYIWVYDTTEASPIKQRCYYVRPERFFGFADRSTNQRGIPARYSIDEDDMVHVDPAPPNGNYELEFLYRRREQELTNDADEPTGLPDKYHTLIVWLAMTDYAEFDEETGAYQKAQRRKKAMLHKLRMDQTPEYTMAGTL